MHHAFPIFRKTIDMYIGKTKEIAQQRTTTIHVIVLVLVGLKKKALYKGNLI